MNMHTYQPSQFLPPIVADHNHLELLFYCLGFVFYAGLPPLDRYLEGILGDAGSVGGDPGWRLCLEDRERATYPEQWDICVSQSKYSGMDCYEAWALADVSGIEPETTYYTIEEVRYYIRIALENIAVQNPERSAEVNEIITRYRLVDGPLI
jgi:hypothetical protein